jgi:hypothetical protein
LPPQKPYVFEKDSFYSKEMLTAKNRWAYYVNPNSPPVGVDDNQIEKDHIEYLGEKCNELQNKKHEFDHRIKFEENKNEISRLKRERDAINFVPCDDKKRKQNYID